MVVLIFDTSPGQDEVRPKKRKVSKLMLLQVVGTDGVVSVDAVTIDVAIVVVVAVGLSEKL